MMNILLDFIVKLFIAKLFYVTLKQMTKKHRESSSSSICHHKKQFDHKIQLQLSDSLGFPVPGTEFWITLTVIKQGDQVTIQLPVINFQTGPSANNPIELPALVPGGYLYTLDGFLPENVRPNDIVSRSVLAPSNNGMSEPFSFTQLPSKLSTPPTGYILQVTNAGGLVVQCAGTFGNIIPPGPQILLPTDITYVVRPKLKLNKNYIIDPGFTSTLQFTNPYSAEEGIRDSHINDAFDGVVAWSWCSNANIPKTNNTVNVFVAVGKIKKDGTLKIGAPVQLSNLPPGFMAWDTSVAINRKDKKNIVVSYAVINNVLVYPQAFNYTCRAVSFDGGKTWPAPFDGVNSLPLNGFTNIQPTGFYAPGAPGGAGDNPGVKYDQFGNIWYGTTNYFDNNFNLVNQPTYWISSDKGITFSVAYTLPSIPPDLLGIVHYDFPQFCFGQDGSGNYGFWFVVDYINSTTGDLVQDVGFIPITGLGQYDLNNVSFVQLTSLINTNQAANITASDDGRVWIQGTPNLDDGPIDAGIYIQPQVVTFKSPGLIDQNYAGPWNIAIINNGGQQYLASTTISQPYYAYFTSPRSIIYDDSRQALYALACTQSPEYSQNMRLYFVISRDNGQTWSQPIDIETDDKGNRGFQSMTLDPVTHNLVFGWYDGRNDPTFQSIQYFGAVITSKTLDKLVNNIPLSNPLYTLSPATTPLAITSLATTPATTPPAIAIVKVQSKRSHKRQSRRSLLKNRN